MEQTSHLAAPLPATGRSSQSHKAVQNRRPHLSRESQRSSVGLHHDVPNRTHRIRSGKSDASNPTSRRASDCRLRPPCHFPRGMWNYGCHSMPSFTLTFGATTTFDAIVLIISCCLQSIQSARSKDPSVKKPSAVPPPAPHRIPET